jgi:hypothetical protein
MTFDEIKKTYPNEWVLIAEPELDETLEVRSGIVVAHSPRREQLDAAMREQHGHLAIRYTGKIRGRVFVL